MERPPHAQHSDEADDELVTRVRDQLEEADGAGDEARLETLENLRTDLEAELDSSLENGTPRH